MIHIYPGRIDPKTGFPEQIEVEQNSVGEALVEVARDVLDAAPLFAVAGILLGLKK